VPREDWIDESVVRVQKVEDTVIALENIEHEADRLFEHRLAQLIVEGSAKRSRSTGVELFKPAEIEPVFPPNSTARARTRLLISIRFVCAASTCAYADHSLPRVTTIRHPACSTRENNSAGWPAHHPTTGACTPAPWRNRSMR
jgi:hypothetical protein